MTTQTTKTTEKRDSSGSSFCYPSITVTGIDERTPIDELPGGIEVGILFTVLPEGRHRYPSRSRIAKMLLMLDGQALALHVCGRAARQLLMDYQIPDLTHGVERIQVNGDIMPDDLRMICDLYGDHQIITQHTNRTRDLLAVGATNHAVLVDGSGGRGLSPDRWDRPDTPKPVGFAGGLGPDNIASEIAKIAPLCDTRSWIDMEGKLRNENDWFDVERVRLMLARIDG